MQTTDPHDDVRQHAAYDCRNRTYGAPVTTTKARIESGAA